MYKVFINDKEIRFVKPGTSLTPESRWLSGNPAPRELVAAVKSYPDLSVRVFLREVDHPAREFERFTAFFTTIEAAGGVVRKHHARGEILMIFRLGKWDLPKGKIDKGESHEQAALREVHEECGIGHLRIVKRLKNTFHLYELKGKWVLKKTYWYLMVSEDNAIPAPQTDEGITEAKWLPERDIYYLLPLSYASISDLLVGEVLHR